MNSRTRKTLVRAAGLSCAAVLVAATAACSSLPAEITLGAATTLPTATGPGALLHEDMNGDGMVDIVTADFLAGSVSILAGDGKGGFAEPTSTMSGMGTSDVGVGDFNGDDNLDVAASNYFEDTIALFFGDGEGGLAKAVKFTAGKGVNPNHMTVADVNNDGNPDVLTSNFHMDGVSVLLGDGEGGLGEPAQFPVVFDPIRITTSDVDNDGNLDVVLALFGSNEVGILLGDGSGGFREGQSQPTGHQPAGLDVEDVNGDGNVDLVTGSFGDNNVGVHLGNGDGSFEDPRYFPVNGEAPSSLVVADLNADGLQDVAVGNGVSNDVAVLRGDGAGYFSDPANFVTKGDDARGGIIAVDLDGDEMLDVVTANHNSNDLSVLLNAGTAAKG